jgi:hypothetical protein
MPTQKCFELQNANSKIGGELFVFALVVHKENTTSIIPLCEGVHVVHGDST